MSQPARWRGLAALVAVTALICSTNSSKADDVADIRETGRAFLDALASGNASAARYRAQFDDKGAKFIEAASVVGTAAKRLRKAAISRFGDPGKAIVSFSSGEQYDDATIEVTGDVATVRFKSGDGARFLKGNGRWEVDLRQLPDPSLNFIEQAPKFAAAVNAVAGEIEQGKYKTLQEAQQSTRRTVSAAMEAARPAPHADAMAPAETQPSRRRVPQQPDGLLTLWARDTTDIGHCRIAKVADVQCVTGWQNPGDSLRWEASLKTYRDPGIYEVMVTYACDPDAGGAEYEIQAGNQRIKARTTATGEPGVWPQFNSEAVGAVRFDRPEDISISVRVLKKTGKEMMHLRAITLRPATQEQVTQRMKSASPAAPENQHGAAPTVCVDISELPELEDWGFGCREYCRKWYPKIDELLHSDGFTPPHVLGIRVISDPHSVGYNENGGTFNVTAFTTPWNTIIVFHTWALPNDYGMEIHEMSHVIQKYPGGEFWIVEGIADYIRYYVVEPGSKEAAFDPTTAHYKNGYQAASAFLNWMEKTYGQAPHASVIARVNDALRHGTYNAELFKQLTGKDVDELWGEFKATLTEKTTGRN